MTDSLEEVLSDCHVLFVILHFPLFILANTLYRYLRKGKASLIYVCFCDFVFRRVDFVFYAYTIRID